MDDAGLVMASSAAEFHGITEAHVAREMRDNVAADEALLRALCSELGRWTQGQGGRDAAAVATAAAGAGIAIDAALAAFALGCLARGGASWTPGAGEDPFI